MLAVTPHHLVKMIWRVDAVRVLTQYTNPTVSSRPDSPGLRQSGRLSAQKVRHSLGTKPQMLNPAVPRASQKALTCPAPRRTS